MYSGLKKKLYLRSGSKRHRHFVGFFNVAVLHRHGQARIWGGGVSGPPSPGIFKICISENNIFSVIRGVFACAFQKFQARFVRLLWYLFMYVLSPPFNDLAYTFFIFAEQPNPRRISQYTPTLVNVSKYGGVAVAEWLSSWLAEQEVRGSIPGLAIRISEIGYLLFPSRDMAEIPLKRR